MTVLPRGITGFYDSQSDAPPTSNLRDWRKVLHQACTVVGVFEIHHREVMGVPTRNYEISELRYAKEKIYALANIHFPIATFASALMPNQYTDCLELRAALMTICSWDVWCANQSNAAVGPESLSELSKSELRQVRYWQPERIGDIAFNHWD